MTYTDAVQALEATAAWLDREAMIRQPIVSFTRAVRQMFVAQEKAFAREWAAVQARKPALEAIGPQIIDLEIALDLAIEETEDIIIEPYATQAAKALTRGGSVVIEQLELSATFTFDADQQRTLDYIARRGANLVSSVSRTTRWRIRKAIEAQLRQQKGVDEIARHIRLHFRGMRTPKPQHHIRDRAHLIAVTELGEAFEAGGAQAASDMEAAGLAIEKQWITAGDNRVTPACRANAAAGWIPNTQEFPSGHPHPLRFPGCRCATGRRLARDRG